MSTLSRSQLHLVALPPAYEATPPCDDVMVCFSPYFLNLLISVSVRTSTTISLCSVVFGAEVQSDDEIVGFLMSLWWKLWTGSDVIHKMKIKIKCALCCIQTCLCVSIILELAPPMFHLNDSCIFTTNFTQLLDVNPLILSMNFLNIALI